MKSSREFSLTLNFTMHHRVWTLSLMCRGRASHMARLYKVCKAPKVWRELPDGSHNDTVAEPGYFQYIDDFLGDFVTA